MCSSKAQQGFRGRIGVTGAVLLAATLLVCGCASTSNVRNDRLERFTPGEGYRLGSLEAGKNNSDSLLVVLTFSGGGTRAASLAYGVLEVLQDTRITWDGTERSLLDEVDIISSVSGGSLPAAYYGLFGSRIFEDFPDKVLYENIQGSLIKQILDPRTNVRLFSPFYTRTDIMAERFGAVFFEDKTFSDLLARGKRPFLIINSTDMAQGTRFAFTQDQFDFLYSDLGAFPVGYAVAASAAFPGAFPPLTLRNYEKGPDYRLPEWAREVLAAENPDSLLYKRARNLQMYERKDRPYIHLTDGGVADNLGLLPVIQMLRQFIGDGGNPGATDSRGIEKILVLTVNAEVSEDRGWDTKQSPLGLIATLLAAGTTPLSNFTSAEIEYMRLLLRNFELRGLLNCGGVDANGEVPSGPDCRFVEVSFESIENEEQRRALDSLPTSFKLEREQVDLLRAAAVQILAQDKDFQSFVSGLQIAGGR